MLVDLQPDVFGVGWLKASGLDLNRVISNAEQGDKVVSMVGEATTSGTLSAAPFALVRMPMEAARASLSARAACAAINWLFNVASW